MAESDSFYCELSGRGLVFVGGAAARDFLHGILTCDIAGLDAGAANFGALLTPQGKILFDFFVVAEADGFLFDIDAAMAEDFIRRLMFYRLRAKVEIGPYPGALKPYAFWGAEPADQKGRVIADPRLGQMGWRGYLAAAPTGCRAGDYDAHRVAIGMPEGGKDFGFGDTFPHEALMDQFRGVDFAKGCYVGQEVVSRVQHRNSARKRLITITAEAPLPQSGTEILAGKRVCGTLASVSGKRGLAMIRLDRAQKAMAAGDPIRAGAVPATLALQDWANFDWPAGA